MLPGRGPVQDGRQRQTMLPGQFTKTADRQGILVPLREELDLPGQEPGRLPGIILVPQEDFRTGKKGIVGQAVFRKQGDDIAVIVKGLVKVGGSVKAMIHPVIHPGHHEKAVGGQGPFGGEQIKAAEITDAVQPVPPLPADARITLQAVVIILGLPVLILEPVLQAMVFTLPGGSGKQAAAVKGKEDDQQQENKMPFILQDVVSYH